MSLKAAIYSTLTTDGTVSGLIGTKVYPVFASANQATPYVVFERDSEDANFLLDGNKSGLIKESYSFQAFSNTVAESDAIIDAVLSALEGMQRTAVSGVRFSAVFFNSRSDGYESLIDGDQLPTFSEIITLDFWYCIV